jgi:hypothetical protein
VTTHELDPFRDLPGIRRYWNPAIVVSPAIAERLIEIGDEVLAVYMLLNRSADHDGLATIGVPEIAARLLQTERAVREWIGTLRDMGFIEVIVWVRPGFPAKYMIRDWDELRYNQTIEAEEDGE